MHFPTLAAWLIVVTLAPAAGARAQDSLPASPSPAPTFDAAQQLFFTGMYEAAADMALALRARIPDDLASYELRTAALHFQIKRAMGDAEDRGKAFKACAACPALVAEFMKDFREGQRRAKAAVEADATDLPSRFFLGKIDLNYVWLQLGTLGKRTGWDEYWEARKSLDKVLEDNPAHVRARVARAWIDYIVDTRVSWGLKWLLGGGSRKKGLAAVREAAATTAERYVQAEARFALWEMLVREKNVPEALIVARGLAADFPANQDLIKFLAKHEKK